MKRVRKVKNVLLLDLGFTNLGAAVVTEKGEVLFADTIRPDAKVVKGAVTESTILVIRDQLRQLDVLFDRYRPRRVLVEYPSGGSKSAHASKAMHLATGMYTAYLLFRRPECPFYVIRPSETKRLVRAKGAVEKSEIQDFVREKFGDVLPKAKCRAEHAADALATYFVYVNDPARFMLRPA